MQEKGNNLKTTLNGIQVTYSDQGPENAPAVIFIHGFPFNRSMWDGQVKAIQQRYRVVTYDIRGHGDSGIGDEEFSIGLFVEDLLALMDHLGIGKAILCGLSMGGYIALLAMEVRPERFSGLVLCDTQCVADSPEAKEKRMKTIETIREKGVEHYAEESIGNFFGPPSFPSRHEEIAKVGKMIRSTHEESLRKTLMALAERKETCEQLHRINVPVLIIVGADDKITPPSASLMMHHGIKNAGLEIIESAGHISNLEQPEVFNEKLEQFLVHFDQLQPDEKIV